MQERRSDFLVRSSLIFPHWNASCKYPPVIPPCACGEITPSSFANRSPLPTQEADAMQPRLLGGKQRSALPPRRPHVHLRFHDAGGFQTVSFSSSRAAFTRLRLSGASGNVLGAHGAAATRGVNPRTKSALSQSRLSEARPKLRAYFSLAAS